MSQPTAYSYIRFSSSQQRDGDSLRRQTEASRQYANDHHLTLDESLNLGDLGVSAFEGKNFESGALRAFITAVEDGRVAKGSYLLVESLDRLSRLPVMEALANFQLIIGKGINIVTLTDRAIYSKDGLNDNWTGLIVALATMARANEESATKSTRSQSTWATKKVEARNTRKPIGDIAPLWLEYVSSPHPKYTENCERVTIIRRIFDLTIGGYGKVAIVKLLNAESVPSFKPPTINSPNRTWGTSSIQKILCNRAVIGEYQPFAGRGKERKPVGAPIPDYYPKIISESTFYQAQQASGSRKVAGATKQTKRFNIWQGVARCLHCLAALHIVNKGIPPKGNVYLTCSNARKGVCNARSIRLEQSELVFKEILAKVDSLSLVQDSSASISKNIAAIEGQLSIEDARLVQLASDMHDYPSTTLAKLTQKCEQRISELQKEKEALLMTLASESITDKTLFFSKLDIVTYEGRYRANELLKRLKIRVSIDRGDVTTTYLLSRDGQLFLGLQHDPSLKILFLALEPDMMSKVKAQDFDGSIESTIAMIMAERFSDIIRGEWWSDAVLEGKVTEMLARIDVVLATDSREFREIKERLTAERLFSGPKMEEWAESTLKWARSLNEEAS